MAAYHRMSGCEVAVKFIIKSKVPEHAWTEDEIFGRLPVEVIILRNIEHENIVKFIDLFEDSLYLYLVQELHGTPWTRLGQLPRCSPNPTSPTPSLSSSPSDASFPQIGPLTPTASSGAQFQEQLSCQPSPDLNIPKILRTLTSLYEHRPDIHRHASHDLFECIEQTDHKCLTEDQARHVFSQVVEAVHYLDMQGIFHRDIKDENILVDTNFKIKLIDFGSAIVTDPGRPRPFYQQFFGTAAYAASEILRQEKYQAPPAEIWTLGVLLSYLLTGTSPFATVKDAADGTLTLMNSSECGVTTTAIELLQRCLDPNPRTRATIEEVKAHPWLSKSS
ncbi:hypothetical protein AMATHDRAFT_175049 [Amanita thiersii Skay4041]|uniref:Protein kinase domain-containing protein n=1 Tax=Amanita thiersii Skay4041 TaxID=703135 RepID=A0A2A9NT84_9AGAR|nr:hypothetical protein AMATHDRAFT_175049 [Amanita thiersii Skay4041]